MQGEIVSSPIVSADSEGDIVFDFSTEMEMLGENLSIGGADQLIQQESPVLLYVTSKPSDNLVGASTSNALVAAAVIDFRFSLFFSTDPMSVELLQCDQDGVNLGVEAGVLYVRMAPLELPEKIRTELEETRARQVIEHGIQSYQEKLTGSNKLLYRHARAWWSRVRRLYPFLENRNIRILGEDECGSHRFACCMLNPLVPPRELVSPRFAARFVSLIPFRSDPGLRGGRADGWRSSFATLCRMQGSTEDHALLLCSLLLGWGLDTWVALGTATEPSSISDDNSPKKEFSYCWVVTLDHDSSRPHFPAVTFWDVTTGSQVQDVTGVAGEEVTSHHFRELHALFNHKVFAVNVQHLTAVSTEGSRASEAMMSFDMTNERNFQILTFPEADAVRVMTHPGSGVTLRAGIISSDVNTQEIELENKIRAEFSRWRSEINLQTFYDDSIGAILQPALVSYEWNKAVQVSFGNTDFQAALKRRVGKGDIFKGCPVSFNHTNSDEIMKSLKRNPSIRDIAVATGGLKVSHGVRVKIFPYPEGAMAVWVMLTVCIQNSYTGGLHR